MKHRRGIDLGRQEKGGITYLEPLKEPAHTVFEDLKEWIALGASCPSCEREAWLDRWELQRKYGKGAYIGQLTQWLRCRGCNNKVGNKWIIGQLPR